MKQYTIIHPLYMAFYSKSLYRDVASNWPTWFCFLYLLSLLALCWIPGMIRLDSDISEFVDAEAPKYVNQMPVVSISKGQASLAEPQPYIIKDPEKGDPVMIIDTTGQTTSIDNSKAMVLLTKTQLILKDRLQGSRMLNLSEIGDMTIDKAMVYDWLEAFLEWFAILLYPFAVLFSFTFKGIQAALYALIGILFSRIIKAGLNYKAMIRLAVISLTPVIILNTLTIFFRVPIPEPWLTNALITTGYLIFAIRASTYRPSP
jgi:hypothetical protein